MKYETYLELLLNARTECSGDEFLRFLLLLTGHEYLRPFENVVPNNSVKYIVHSPNNKHKHTNLGIPCGNFVIIAYMWI